MTLRQSGADDAAGDLVAGRYRLERRLGAGGMGIVYRARDLTGDRDLALKRIGAREAQRRASGMRFRREFHTLASLRHPRIVEAYDYGIDDDGAFYTMELLGGRDLRDERRLAPREVALVLRDIAAALGFLHARGLVHRDVSPRNVRVDDDGRAKLIDFGMLGTVGLVGDLAGTMPFIAPEVFRGLPIDGRTDLYALGVIGYRLLTGRIPYDITDVEKDPEAAFGTSPLPPSADAPDTPPALDAILLALISSDPLARPPSAAAVIDALGGALDLPPLDASEVARGYLASVAMVGRKRELASLRRRIRRAANGRGSGLVLRAESGAGKSRLLREAQLEGKLVGTLTVLATCETSARGPYAVMEAIARAILDAAPDVARKAARGRSAELAAALTGLSSELGDPALSLGKVDPGEDCMRLQRALLDWLLEVAAQRPLVLLVDDVQRCDEASCAVLAALLRESAHAPVLVVLAERTREEVRAAAALAVIRGMAKIIDLEGLRTDDLRELLLASFGDVPGIDRLAQRLAGVSGGSPLVATEIVRQLVDTGVVRWVDGTWLIPTELPSAELPSTLVAAVDARLARLDDDSLCLGEVLALHGGPVEIERAVTLGGAAGQGGEPRIFAALDALAREGVLVAGDGAYRFRHDGFREGLSRRLDADRKRALHRAVGEVLVVRGDLDPEDEAKVGWHLLEGGDEARGAELLCRAGERLYRAQALADCIAPLEAALEVLDESTQRRDEVQANEIAGMLLAAGWVSNRAAGSRHARRAVDAYRDACGFTMADRLSPYVGGVLSLVLGFVIAGVRWIAEGARGPGPVRAMSSFAQALAYAASLANAENRVDDLLAFVELARPMRVFPIGMPRGVYLFILGLPDILLGRIKQGQRRFTEAIERTANDRFAPVTRDEQAFAEVAMRGIRLLLDVNQFESRVDDDLAVIDAAPFRYYHLVADATRCVRHRYRGEEEKAVRIERKMEVASVQLGSWSTDVQILFFAHPAYSLSSDALGLRRSLEALEALQAQGFRLATRIAITRADYLRTCGRAREAVDVLAPVIEGLRPDDQLMEQWGGSALADALLAAGDHDACIARCERILALDDDVSGLVLPRLRAVRIMAAALSARGEQERAIALLGPAIAEAEKIDCPPLCAQLHEARARIALVMGDRDAYGEHGAAAIRWVRPTRNPSLLALCQRLVEDGASTHFADSRVAAEWAVTAPAPSATSGEASGTSSRTSAPVTGDLPPPAPSSDPLVRDAETMDASDREDSKPHPS